MMAKITIANITLKAQDDDYYGDDNVVDGDDDGNRKHQSGFYNVAKTLGKIT